MCPEDLSFAEVKDTQPEILLAVGTNDFDWPACNCISLKVNKKSQHSRFVWDPSGIYYTKAQEVSFEV